MAVSNVSTQTENDYFGGSLDSRRVYSPCRWNCPVHIDVPGYVTAVAEGRFTDALEIILARNPLPSVCGRICLRPCEDGCRRCQLDDPLAIAHIKRSAADFGAYPVEEPIADRSQSIAVVGSGPTGLTTAYDLAKLGFKVTLYEEKSKLGGMLRYGIPNYRLPDSALDKDIKHILSLGIDVQTDVRVGKDITLEELQAAHDAVVITVGLQGSRPLPIPGADFPHVLSALPFLEAAANGERVQLGKRVVVVGGGNVAMDVARTARRLGASEVALVCLESPHEMPASQHEVEEARLEGISVNCSWGPREVVGQEDVAGLKVARCLSVFDEEKRFSPTFDENEVKGFAADTVIFAVGQGADAGDLGVKLTPRGGIKTDPITLLTSAEHVYAAGDVVAGPTKAIDAIAAGHRAAACVVRDLIGDGSFLAELDEEAIALGEVPDSMKSKIETRRRVQMERLEFYEAVESFDEVECGYTEYEAAREAQRCLGCATGARLNREKCASCLTCIRVCPHNAPGVRVGGFLYFDAEACYACGACASQCPAQAISLEGHSEEEMSRRVEAALAGSGPDTSLVFACGSTPVSSRFPGDTRTIAVSCLLRASARTVLKALELGATRVVFTGCVESTCRYPYARDLVATSAEKIRATLKNLGMEDAFVVIGGEVEEEDTVHLR
jgi:NADPH-dependent glutamate synthase beta subunit-like oxidoreductase/Fe-S-cluster-containing hydrogenase component 2